MSPSFFASDGKEEIPPEDSTQDVLNDHKEGMV
jgi:hypothetical protein